MNGVSIRYGDKVIPRDEIKSVKITQEYDPLSLSLIISTADIEISTRDKGQYNFVREVPFYVFFDDELKIVAYLDTKKSESKTKIKVSAEDFIGRLEDFTFGGDVYSGINAKELIDDIMKDTGIPYTVDVGFNNMSVSGRIPYTNCREALAHVLFATGGVTKPQPEYSVSTGIGKLVIGFNDEGNVESIPENRTLQGVKVEQEEQITGVEVTAHKYARDAVQKTLHSFTSEEIKYPGKTTLMFEPPVYRLYIAQNETTGAGEIVAQSANFADIKFKSPYEFNLYGYEYIPSSIVDGIYAETATRPKIYAIEDKTLVNGRNSQEVLQRCFDYYSKNTKATAKIVEGKHYNGDKAISGIQYDSKLHVGQIVTIPTEDSGFYTGRILKQKYSLNGNIIIKEITIK